MQLCYILYNTVQLFVVFLLLVIYLVFSLYNKTEMYLKVKILCLLALHKT